MAKPSNWTVRSAWFDGCDPGVPARGLVNGIGGLEKGGVLVSAVPWSYSIWLST